MILYFQVASDGIFVTPTNAALLIRQTAAVAVAAAGVAILIIMGEIDLSIGSVAFLSGLVAASCQVAGWGVVPSVLAAVAMGAAIGLVQGLVITRLAVPAFVVTLGGLLLWRGLGLAWTDAAAIGPVSSEYSALTEGRMPPAMTVLLVVAVLAFTAWSAYRKHRTAAHDGGAASMKSSRARRSWGWRWPRPSFGLASGAEGCPTRSFGLPPS